MVDRRDQARRRTKRQAAPFSKGPPNEQPKKPGRRTGERHGRHASVGVGDRAPVADRTNWTLPRLQAEIARQAAVSISKSQLSKTLKKMATDGVARVTAWPDARIPTRSTAPGSGSR